MADGFLGRWSRRKLDAREGKPTAQDRELAAPVAPLPKDEANRVACEAHTATLAHATVQPTPLSQPQAPAQGSGAAPSPTLEDVSALRPESDFRRFVAPGVTPEVKNAAMKKLFADPRYNVMDGMDVYVDDYSKSEPIAPAVLRQLASAKFLGLFNQEERDAEEAARPARDVADNPAVQSVAQCDPGSAAVPEPTDHAHADLRLQQDHAAAGDDPGDGAG